MCFYILYSLVSERFKVVLFVFKVNFIGSVKSTVVKHKLCCVHAIGCCCQAKEYGCYLCNEDLE